MSLNRSTLVTPGSDREMIRKATGIAADTLVIDLEDAVAPSMKAEARENVVEAANEYALPETRLSVRVNEPASKYVYDDVRTIIGGAGDHIDSIVLPKTRRPGDVYAVDSFLSTVEEAASVESATGIDVLVEDVEGFHNMHGIGAASQRVGALVFGSHDYAVSIRGAIPVAEHDGSLSGYDDPFWDYLQVGLVQAANYCGVEAITTVGDDNFSDLERFRHDCERGKGLGFTGGWAIHPDQVEILNETYAPRAADVEYARTVIDAFERAQEEEGRAAINFEGTMVTRAHYENATKILRYAEEAGASDTET